MHFDYNFFSGKANLKIRKCFLQFHGNNLSFLLWKDGKMMHFGDISYFDFSSAYRDLILIFCISSSLSSNFSLQMQTNIKLKNYIECRLPGLWSSFQTKKRVLYYFAQLTRSNLKHSTMWSWSINSVWLYSTNPPSTNMRMHLYSFSKGIPP